MTTTTHSHNAWTDEGGHVRPPWGLAKAEPADITKMELNKRAARFIG
jgi:hypothetical protein